MKDGPSFSLWIIGAAVLAALAYNGIFYQTGKQWYDTCWSAKHSKDGPKSADEAAAWGKCEYVARKALFDKGFIFSGNPDNAVTPALKEVVESCPSNYSDIPLSGVDTLAIDLIEQQGGASFWDKFLPANNLINHVFLAKWPNCPVTRSKWGFPKIVEKNGSFDWESECKPCEAERNAAAGNK